MPIIRRFYLAGGTGLALHFGHRFSVDLDFFSEQQNTVDAQMRSALKKKFKDKTLELTHDKDTTFVATWRQVGISFFEYPAYPLVKSALDIEGISLASIQDIGAMKLSAIINRASRKDLVDLYFILQTVTLEELFRVAAVKYHQVPSFAVMAVRGLAFFDDAEAFPMPRMIDKTRWSKMKKFLEHQALEAGRKQLEKYWH